MTAFLKHTLRLVMASSLVIVAACGDDPAPRPVAGESCEAPVFLTLSPERVPLRVGLDIAEGPGRLTLGSCELQPSATAPGTNTAETVYRLRADVPALWRLSLERADGGDATGAFIAAASDCAGLFANDEGSCLASSLSTLPSAPVIDVVVGPDTDVFVVVDAPAGAWNLRIGCGCAAGSACLPTGFCRAAETGDSCADAVSFGSEAFPRVFEGTTAGGADGGLIPAACLGAALSVGMGAPDRTHVFEAPIAGRYPVVLAATGGLGVGVGAFAGCQTTVRDAACVVGATAAAGRQAEFALDLGAGDNVHFLVDGLVPGLVGGGYRLEVGAPCVPVCEGCGGDDGCGRACGCEAGSYCQDGTCVDDLALLGNTCRNPHPLVFGADGVARGDGDIGAGSGLGPSKNAFGCNEMAASGAHVADEVWRFEAPTAGRFDVRVTPGARTADLLVHAWTGGGADCADAACVGYADAEALPGRVAEVMTLDLEAGAVVDVVVGAWRREAAGPYVVEVRPACVPVCNGCGGDDACGGTCGCDGDGLCDAGVCRAPETIVGNTCALPLQAGPALPFEGRGDIGPAALRTAATHALSCDDYVTGGAGRDEVWRFVAPAAGHFEVSVVPEGPQADLMVYALDAACATCAAFADAALAGGGERLVVVAEQAGQVFHLAVDAWEPGAGGAYALRIETACAPRCGDGCGGDDGCGGVCGCPGGTCVNGACLGGPAAARAACLGAVPLDGPRVVALNGDSALAPLGCPGAHTLAGRGSEAVFMFEAPTTGAFDIIATPLDHPVDLVVYAYAAGGCPDGRCLGLADAAPLTGLAEVLRLEAQAGARFVVVVDTFARADAGRVRVEVQPACVPECVGGAGCGQEDGCGGRCGCGADGLCRDGMCVAAATAAGDRCETARELGGIAPPFVGHGDLRAFLGHSDAGTAAGCGLQPNQVDGRGAPDAFWRFTAPEAGPWEIALTPGGGGSAGDLLLYVFAGAACDAGCLGFSDGGGRGAGERVIVEAAAPGAQFTIVVDAFSAATTDAYTLRVGRPCTPVCGAGGGCGDDGCGGRCPCEAGEVCGDSGVCRVAAPGDTCAVARELTGPGALPWAAAGDVGPASGLTDQFSASACGQSMAGRDAVWRVVPPGPGVYTLVARPEGAVDVGLHLSRGAVCGGGCVQAADLRGPGVAESVRFASDGQPVWAVVEAVGAGGGYVLELAVACVPSCGAGCGGDDGCGGVCGCPAGGVCDGGGSCVDGASVAGNTCQTARALEVIPEGWGGVGDLSQGLGDAFTGIPCGAGPVGRGGPDEVWAFAPPEGGDWDITVTPIGGGELSVHAYDDAACTRCVGLADADRVGGQAESLRLRGLVPGAEVRIVVDQFAPLAAGPYRIVVRPACDPDCAGASCGDDDGCGGLCGCADAGLLCDAATTTCGAPEAAFGNTCDTARPITAGDGVSGDLAALPFLDDRLDAGGCPNGAAFTGAGVRDEVFAFTATRTGFHTVTLTPAPGADLMLYAFHGDLCAPLACIAHADAAGDGAAETLNLWLAAGDAVRLVVDAWTSAATGAYTLSIGAP